MSSLVDRDPERWWEIAGEVSAEICELINQRLSPYGREVPPGDAVGMLILAIGRFAGAYTSEQRAPTEDAWKAVVGCKQIFVTGYEGEIEMRQGVGRA